MERPQAESGELVLVSRIRLYDGPLNASEVAALACEEILDATCG